MHFVCHVERDVYNELVELKFIVDVPLHIPNMRWTEWLLIIHHWRFGTHLLPCFQSFWIICHLYFFTDDVLLMLRDLYYTDCNILVKQIFFCNEIFFCNKISFSVVVYWYMCHHGTLHRHGNIRLLFGFSPWNMWNISFNLIVTKILWNSENEVF